MGNYPQTLTFLVAHLVYSDAIQTVITVPSQFGNGELKILLESLTLAIPMVRFVGFSSAILFNCMAEAIGAKRVVALAIGTGVLLASYFSVKTPRRRSSS